VAVAGWRKLEVMVRRRPPAYSIAFPGVVVMGAGGTRRTILPSRYVQGQGVLGQLGDHVKSCGSRPFCVSGRTAFSKVRARAQASLLVAGVPFVGHDDTVKECTMTKIRSVVERVEDIDADVVVGCGGGKAVDVAKAVADEVSVPVICIPTQCATNADGMADAVVYTADHKFVKDLYLNRAPYLVLVDTEVVGRAPAMYLVQGMGDALAAVFEKSAYASALRLRKGDDGVVNAAVAVNRTCFETLMAYGVQAKKDAEAGRITEPLEAVIEAIKLQSGFGFGGGGCAAAHALHNGLVLVPGVARKHGEIVAFCTLVQMVLEQRPMAEVERVIRWCRSVGLPVTLRELGDLDLRHLPEAAQRACDTEDTMQFMPFEVSPKMVLDAIGDAEGLARSI
jgi:glycerol dehydrogenase